ncbi:hypothetical protein ACOCEA_13870 [Maribacter sp. CXY002]|uniref:hypothetical protein n=1 Tax=Maribacter luteocoastalis TaxID=3407671 RepID=UPI003B67255A
MKTKYKMVLLIFLFFQGYLFSQNSKRSAKEISTKNESYFLTDISYINDAVFMGRRDSVKAPYILPSVGYYDKSGFFLDASASYLTSSEENRVDLFLLSAGYLFNDSSLSGGISGTGYFFNGDSYNVRSETVGDISGFLTLDLKSIEISLLASTFFNDGSSADIFAGLMLGHTFSTTDNTFFISPTIAVYAGSQNFYEAYYNSSRLGNRKGKGQGQNTTSGSTVITEVIIEEASKFNMLDLEVSLPLQYYYNHFIFSFSPVLAMPQSSATITTEDAVIEEDLDSVFYFSAGISYWFNP